MDPVGRTTESGSSRLRGVVIVVAVIAVTAATAMIISAFGDSGIENAPEMGAGAQRVRTAGERCAAPLMDGWTWEAGSWTLVSPNGTRVGMAESLMGRPMYADWDEMVDEVVGRYDGRSDVDIVRSAELVRIDFGSDGGLSVIQRFDRVACFLTFAAPSPEVRDQESETWETLIDSIERVYPSGQYTEERAWQNG